MKSAVNYSYTFTPTSRTINFSGIVNFDIKKLYAVINITANQLIYAVGQSKFGYSSLTSSTLTLVYNTSTMNAADNLMILYDDQAIQQNVLSSFNPGSFDIFGSLITGTRNNSIEVDFSTGTAGNKINTLLSGGGTATISNGQASVSSGTSTTAQAAGSSYNSIRYDPGHEIYAEFTATFTTPTSANSYQKIGLYDTNNGVYIGYIGTTFGVTLRSGTVDTTVTKSSFNIDTLVGAYGSKYTRNGVPEAIDLNKFNVYRIRFGWLGVAPILFEVLSPDGAWVTYHKIVYPNTAVVVSMQSPNLPMTIDISKTSADTTDLIMNTACWAAGTTSLATIKKLGLGVSSSDSGQIVQSVPVDGAKATYSASVTGLNVAGSPTDIFTISGSSSKVIKITRIEVSGTQTTAAQRDVVLLKRSTTNTGGANTSPNKVPYDSGDIAASATVLVYTTNPALLGTLVGNITVRKLVIPTTTTTSTDQLILDFGLRPSKAITLRGTSELLAINLNGVSSGGNSLDITVEWSEEDYIR